MSTPKKVSQLSGTTIDGTEKFHVSKNSNDYAVSINDVKSFIGSSSGALEVWDLATFQANANTILPLGKKVYYRKGDGKVTGIHKMGDGVTNVANLPLFFDQFNLAPYDSINYSTNSNILWTINSVNSYLFPNYTTLGSLDSTYAKQFPVVIHFPINVDAYNINVTSFTTAGSLRIALYSVNADGTGTLVSGSYAEMTISNVGFNTVNITPLFLEPGVYYGLIYKPTGTFSIYLTSKNFYEIDGNNINFTNQSTSMSPPPQTIGRPTTFSNYPTLYLSFQKTI